MGDNGSGSGARVDDEVLGHVGDTGVGMILLETNMAGLLT